MATMFENAAKVMAYGLLEEATTWTTQELVFYAGHGMLDLETADQVVALAVAGKVEL